MGFGKERNEGEGNEEGKKEKKRIEKKRGEGKAEAGIDGGPPHSWPLTRLLALLVALTFFDVVVISRDEDIINDELILGKGRGVT